MADKERKKIKVRSKFVMTYIYSVEDISDLRFAIAD
jgi:hypothetical protein